MGNPDKFIFSMKVIILLLALIAFSNCTLRCIDGYYKMYTRRTIQESLWANTAGNFNCISAGVPCAGHTASEAERIIRSDWTANGGASYKAFTSNDWCHEDSQGGSHPWQGSTHPAVTWRYSHIGGRRMMKK